MILGKKSGHLMNTNMATEFISVKILYLNRRWVRKKVLTFKPTLRLSDLTCENFRLGFDSLFFVNSCILTSSIVKQ
jgi:hypothetical protein